MATEIEFGFTIERRGKEIDLTIYASCESSKESGVGSPVMEILEATTQEGYEYALTTDEVKDIEDKGFRLLDAKLYKE